MRTQSQNPRTAGLARALRPLIVVVGLAGLLLGRWVAPVACQPATTLATEAPSVEGQVEFSPVDDLTSYYR